jgi:hypothetical protein
VCARVFREPNQNEYVYPNFIYTVCPKRILNVPVMKEKFLEMSDQNSCSVFNGKSAMLIVLLTDGAISYTCQTHKIFFDSNIISG